MSSDQIQLPDLQTLFGQISFCQCDQCGSVYSPAAYLVDVLHSIVETKISSRDKNNKILKSGTDMLFARRPDIGTLELSCDNTNVPVPYVDLVNEILENAVSPKTAVAH